MRLLRHGARGRLDADGRVRDLSGIIVDVADAVLCPDTLRDLARIPDASLPIVEPLRIGACVGAVGKIVCVGLNYADHAAEAGRELPSEPVLFLKATSAISGPCDDIERPVGATKLDYEVELGVIIGRRAKVVAVDAALQHVAGYCVVNDVSERAFQSERGDSGPRARARTPSPRSAPGSSPATRSRIRRRSICGSTSTGRPASADRPRTWCSASPSSSPTSAAS